MEYPLVTIVGVGALGSHTAMFLRNTSRLKVVDFDRVETRNTTNQFHSRNSVGKNKTLALQQVVNFLWGVKVDIVPHKLVEGNAQQLLGKSDLILDCLDNGEARRIVQGFVRRTGVPCLHGALAANGAYGQVCWDEHFQVDDEGTGVATCEDGHHLPFIALVSAFMARAVQTFLENGGRPAFHIHPGGRVICS